MSNFVVVGFLTLLLQVQRSHLLYLRSAGVLNEAAARVTCSGYAPLPSKLMVAKQLHPLQGSLILKPQCGGGADAYKPIIPVGKVFNVFYKGDHSLKCLFKKGTAYTLDIKVVADGSILVGTLTVSCPLKLVTAKVNPNPFPPYNLNYKSGPMPTSVVGIKCNYDSSVDMTFIPQKRKKILLVSCFKVKFTYTVEATAVKSRAVLDADPFTNCVFRSDIPSVRDGATKWKRDAKTIKGIEVSVFDYSTLACEGTGVIVPCKPPPPTTTTTPAPTTEKFTTQKFTTQQWTTEGFTTEPTPEETTPGPTTTEDFPTEPSTTQTTRPTTSKVTTSKATTPKPTTPRATSPKPKPTTPRATSSKATTPKATSPKPKPTTPRATSPRPKPTTPRATSPKATTPRATSPKPKPTTPRATSPRPKPTTPRATSPRPKPTTPRATSPRPKPTTPRATSPRPKPTTPRATSPRPKPTTPRATSPRPKPTTPRATSPRPKPTTPRATSPKPKPTTPRATSPRPKPTTPRATSPKPKPTTPRATSPRPKPTTPRATSPKPKPTKPRATSPKPRPTTPKAATPKATTPKPTTPKPTTPKVTTPKATPPKPTTPKVTPPKPTTPKVTTPKPTTPKVTTPKPTTHKATTPKPTTPKVTTPKPTTPKVTTPKPTMPKVTTPKPTTPKATTPKATTSKTTTPKATTLKPTTPKVTTPKVTTPKPTTPKVTTPKPTTPKATTPKPTTPKVTTPKPTTPKVTTPKATTPKPTTLKPTTPKATTLKPTTPKATTLKPTTPKATTLKPTTPKPTTLKPTTPKPTTLKPTTPKATTLKPTTPKATTLKPTTPKATTLKPTTPKPTTLKPTTPKPTTLKPTTPKATTLKPTTPKATTLKPTTRKPTTPKPTTRKPTTPKVTTHKPTTKATTPKPTTRKPTTPKVTTPKPTTPKPTTSKATTPKPTTPRATPPPPGFTLNKAATWITCSSSLSEPSSIYFSENLHPLHKLLVLRPSCRGGTDITALPARRNVYYRAAKGCLFQIKGSLYTIQFDVLAYGKRSIGRLDFHCIAHPLTETPDVPSTLPPYPLRIIPNLIQNVDIDCSKKDSIAVQLLPQRSTVVAALRCQDSTKTFVVNNTPVDVKIWKKGANKRSRCVFRNDVGIQPGALTPKLNVPVLFFKQSDFSYLGTGSIEPCNENPDKFILDVSSHCGRSTSDAAWISGVSDVDAEFQAVCKSGNVFKFQNANGDRVNYRLPVHFKGDASSKCVFNRKGNSQVYVVTVKASWGEGSNLIHKSNREYQVTCVYGSRGSDDTQIQSISDRLIAAKTMQENKGPDSVSTIQLDVVDVLGAPVTFMPQGRKVKLSAKSKGEGREVGIRTIGCDAIGTTTKARYAVIRAGCGDGLIFKKNEGFTTKGLTSTSPYFKVFAMRDDNLVKFECNFTMCATNCDGSSCSVSRRRRDVLEDSDSIEHAYTRTIRLL